MVLLKTIYTKTMGNLEKEVAAKLWLWWKNSNDL